jgi:hypothetical protein
MHGRDWLQDQSKVALLQETEVTQRPALEILFDAPSSGASGPSPYSSTRKMIDGILQKLKVMQEIIDTDFMWE